VAYASSPANVPAFVPRPTPWKATHPTDDGEFSLDLYMKHGEWKAGLTYAIVIGWLIYRTVTGI
jgi:hypothetical protein